MPSKTSDFLLKLGQFKRNARPDSIQTEIFELLGEFVPFDSAVWGSGTWSAEAMQVHTVHVRNQPPELMVEYAPIWRDDPVFRSIAAAPGVTVNFNTADFPDLSKPMAAHMRKFGLGRFLSTLLIDATTNISTAISWYRTFESQPFSEKERVFKEDVTPHLVRALAESQVDHALQSVDTRGPPIFSAGLCDRWGLLRFTTDDFDILLSEEWPGWQGPYLPEQIIREISVQPTAKVLGNTIVVDGKPYLDLWLLRVRPRNAVDALSQREQQVARLYAEGFTQKEIAQRLALSPATIRNQLTSVFDKLAIKNKAQLVKSIWPL